MENLGKLKWRDLRSIAKIARIVLAVVVILLMIFVAWLSYRSIKNNTSRITYDQLAPKVEQYLKSKDLLNQNGTVNVPLIATNDGGQNSGERSTEISLKQVVEQLVDDGKLDYFKPSDGGSGASNSVQNVGQGLLLSGGTLSLKQCGVGQILASDVNFSWNCHNLADDQDTTNASLDLDLSGNQLTVQLVDSSGKVINANVDLSSLSVDLRNQLAQLKNDLNDLTARVAANQSAIAQNTAEIAQNSSDISANKTDIENNAIQIAQNQSDIADNKTSIQNNSASISQNSANISQNSNNIAQNTTDILALQTDVASIQQIIPTLATNADLAALKTRVAKNEADIQTNRGNISINRQNIANNTTNIATNTAGVAANKSATENNATKIAQNKADVQTNASGVAQNAADILTKQDALNCSVAQALIGTGTKGTLNCLDITDQTTANLTANGNLVTANTMLAVLGNYLKISDLDNAITALNKYALNSSLVNFLTKNNLTAGTGITLNKSSTGNDVEINANPVSIYRIVADHTKITNPDGNLIYLEPDATCGPIASTSCVMHQWIWQNNVWCLIGDVTPDLSGYVTYTNLNSTLAGYTTNSNLAQTLNSYLQTNNLQSEIDNLNRYALKTDLSAYATTADLTNLRDGYTGTLKDLSDAINTKQDKITGAASTIASSDLTARKALISDANGKVAASQITTDELGYLSGATSNLQTQLNGKLASSAISCAATQALIGTGSSGSINCRNITNITSGTVISSNTNLITANTLNTLLANYQTKLNCPNNNIITGTGTSGSTGCSQLKTVYGSPIIGSGNIGTVKYRHDVLITRPAFTGTNAADSRVLFSYVSSSATDYDNNLVGLIKDMPGLQRLSASGRVGASGKNIATEIYSDPIHSELVLFYDVVGGDYVSLGFNYAEGVTDYVTPLQ
jgi:hypothetical protein